MLVNTNVFGPLEVSGEQIFSMPDGLYGFDEVKDFALITHKDNDAALMWYQSVEGLVPSFVVFNPFDIIEGYNPVIEASDLRALGCEKGDNLDYLVIAVVPEDVSKTTVNLKSPIVLNQKSRLARQVILANKEYPIKFPLVDESNSQNA